MPTTLTPTTLGKILHLCPSYTLSFTTQGWEYQSKGMVKILQLSSAKIQISKSLGFFKIQIGSVILGGLRGVSVGTLIRESLLPLLLQVYEDYQQIWEQPQYLREKQRRDIVKKICQSALSDEMHRRLWTLIIVQ